MLPALQGILSSLLVNNLGNVAQAVVDKGLKTVEDKLGVSLSPEMTEEQILKVKQQAILHEQFLVSEQNKNTSDARAMYSTVQTSPSSSWLAKNASYIMDFFVLSSTVVLALLAFIVGVPDTNKELVYMALGSLLTLTGTVVNFHRGSSYGSVQKTTLLNESKENYANNANNTSRK